MFEANPIAERMHKLHAQWVAFTRDQAARLLLWRVSPDERALVDAFVSRECGAETAQTSDLFVQLRAPFVGESGHGVALVEELCAHYEQAAQELDEDALRQRWLAPSGNAAESDVAALVATLASFYDHHSNDGSARCIAVWLDAAEVASPGAYSLWLQRLVHQAPPVLRFLLLDRVAGGAYAPLARAEPHRVTTVPCALDIPSALEALARGDDAGRGAPSTPGARLQLLQTQLSVAVQEHDLPRVLPLAHEATQLALSQGWPQLAAAVQMMLAAGYGTSEQHLDALKAYSQAEQYARQLRTSAREPNEAAEVSPREAELAAQLRLAALLGRAATLFMLRAHRQAADCYLLVAALAHSVHEPRTELDGYRLAAACYDRLGQPDQAWAMGFYGLQFALGMDEETQKSSTLPYLAEQLLRMTRTDRPYRAYQASLEEQLRRLLGSDWRAQLQQTTLPTSRARSEVHPSDSSERS